MPETLEVEVIAIDGAPPPASPPPEKQNPRRPGVGGMPDWRQWSGRVMKLDRRWWPLWILLGAVIVSLLVFVGVFVVAGLLVLSLVRGFLRLLTGSPKSSTFTSVVRRG